MTMADPHHRSESTDSAGSTGSAYQLILDHVLTYPSSYEIPLRTMYTLNCAPRAQILPGRTSPPSNSPVSSPDTGRSGSASSSPDGLSTQAFTDNLLAQVAQLPTQTASLPPSFITSFVQRCFPSDLTKVDFPHALVALDYLKDLELRRRREVRAAMGRLNIDRATLELATGGLASRRPGVERWVRSIEERERKIESLFTRLYIGLRRWILINEMSLQPYSKHNCVAMLNTLYPPVITTQPTSMLTSSVLKDQRSGFFNYITSVEHHGTAVLRNLMQQGKHAGENHGWPAVVRILLMYLQLANKTINECSDVFDERDVAPRKADSGVSFNSIDSLKSTDKQPIPQERHATTVPPTPVAPAAVEYLARPKTPSGSSVPRPGTALEKIARGLRTIGRGRSVAATEMIRVDLSPCPPSPTPTTSDKPRGLRKMRSMGSMGTLDSHNNTKHSPTSATLQQRPAMAAYDVDAMRRQRMRYEAGILAAQKFGNGRKQHA